MTRWSAITRTRRSCSALAYGSRSTAAAGKTSTRSYTTSGDATRLIVGRIQLELAELALVDGKGHPAMLAEPFCRRTLVSALHAPLAIPVC